MSDLYQEWEAISNRISSIKNTTNVFIQALQINSADMYGIKKTIWDEVNTIYILIKQFDIHFSSSLPSKVIDYISEFEDKNKEFFKDAKEKAIPGLTKLSLLESTISYLLNDTQTKIRKSVEVAFAHLQRQLAASAIMRNEWAGAKNEMQYERLGGSFLLIHKILAFKIDATGERTDLVLSEEKIDTTGNLCKSVDGLVLTEWKVVNNKEELQSKIDEAKTQTQLYTRGSLASTELSDYRYLVMVSEKQLDPDTNHEFSDNNIKYRVINIAYNPDTPSKMSRKTSN